MPSRFAFFLLAASLLCGRSGFAQDNDYLKHGKIFKCYDFKKTCEGCYTCEDNRYQVKIKNLSDKTIKSIRYKIYSDVYNKIETKEAKIEGNIISSMGSGIIYICVAEIKHWNISEITYNDNTTSTFIVQGGLEQFLQEADEYEDGN